MNNALPDVYEPGHFNERHSHQDGYTKGQVNNFVYKYLKKRGLSTSKKDRRNTRLNHFQEKEGLFFASTEEGKRMIPLAGS